MSNKHQYTLCIVFNEHFNRYENELQSDSAICCNKDYQELKLCELSTNLILVMSPHTIQYQQTVHTNTVCVMTSSDVIDDLRMRFSSIFCRFLCFSSSVRIYSFLIPISKHFFSRQRLQNRRLEVSIRQRSSYGHLK